MPSRLVVGAAIVWHGQVLAARRTAPAALAGRWELPGGKVEPGERPEEALVRECREELGVSVEVGEPLGADVPAAPFGTLRVFTAALLAGEPRPLEDHDALRWLAYDELDTVAWLPNDRPLLPALRDLLVGGEPLPGGRVGGAVRIGATVRRPTGPWTAAVHELLQLLDQHDVPLVPELLGIDDLGREMVRYVPGATVGAGDVPAAFRTPAVLDQIGRWLAALHTASRQFPEGERVWRRGRLARRPGAVICHHDVSPHNIVLTPTGAVAVVVDWDMAAPGHPLDDVAFAAWQFVLRHGDPPDTEAAGLATLAAAYGTDPVAVLDRVGPRLRGAVRFMRRGAAAGDIGLQRLLRSGIPEATEAGVVEVERRRGVLVAALRG
jgi:mutator protein MutT